MIDLALGLRAHDLRCAVVYLSHHNGVDSKLAAANIPFTCCGLRHGWDPRGPAKLVTALRRFRTRVIHDHVSAPWVRALLPRHRSRAVLASEHGHVLNPSLERKRLRLSIMRRAAARTDFFIAPSSAVAEGVAGVLRFPRARIRVVPHGVALFSGEHQQNGIREEFRNELGLASDALIVVYAGRLWPGKGLLDLWEAFRACIERHPRAILLLAGEGEMGAELIRRRAEVPWGAAIQLLGYRDDLPRILAAADLFVLPSHREALGIVLLEAMTAGLPVVATRTGGIPEVVEDGRTGILVPPENPERLAEALLTLLGDASMRQRFGAAGRERLEQHFTLEHCLDGTVAVYREAGIAPLKLDNPVCTERGNC